MSSSDSSMQQNILLFLICKHLDPGLVNPGSLCYNDLLFESFHFTEKGGDASEENQSLCTYVF